MNKFQEIYRHPRLAAVSILLAFSILFAGCSPAPQVSGRATGAIDISQAPQQEELTDDQSFTIANAQGTFTIKPLADYRIAARVASTEHYSRGWDGLLSPVDLALVWGDLDHSEYKEHISYSQHGRWYYYRYDGDFPADTQFIIEHSANNHLIPATDNIRRALKTVRKGDLVLIDGCLVLLTGISANGRTFSWGTSLSRDDSGAQSCELIYVEQIQVNLDIFK